MGGAWRSLPRMMGARQEEGACFAGLDERLAELARRGCADEPLERGLAEAVLGRGGAEALPLLPLVQTAGVIRRRFFGAAVQVHVLNNVQNGACPEDCGYCGQSKASEAPIQPWRLKSREQIVEEAQGAKNAGAFRYCMVLSGRGPSDDDIEHMVECVREVKRRFGLRTCLSAGLLTESQALRLKEAGLDQLNHNLNTSRRHYGSICTTHTYEDRERTLEAARAAGLSLCSGLIVGMDEDVEDVIEVAYALRAFRAESIPVNFLVPIPGNSVTSGRCGGEALTPEFCLRALCLMRLVNPSAEVRVAAGREIHLRSRQALALEPANSLFVEGYLLTKGQSVLETFRMVRDAGFTLRLEGGDWPEHVRRFVEDGEIVEGSEGEATSGAASACAGLPELSILKEDRVSQRKLARLSVKGAEPQPAR